MRKSNDKLKNTLIETEDLSYAEACEENGLCEFVSVPLGKPVAEFSFHDDTLLSDEPMLEEPQPIEITSPDCNLDLIDNRTLRPQAYGKTPTINGESFLLNRTFKFRKSTVRILNQLKADDPDENIYLSLIIDNAIRYYANNILNKKTRPFGRHQLLST